MPSETRPVSSERRGAAFPKKIPLPVAKKGQGDFEDQFCRLSCKGHVLKREPVLGFFLSYLSDQHLACPVDQSPVLLK
jgi:hypothetical protein